MIAHSVNPHTGKELMTMALVYPRFIHAEARTHRIISMKDSSVEVHEDISFMDDPALSRNAMSSRAVPVQKMIDQVRNDPAMPIHWGSNKPGMQAGEELMGDDLIYAKRKWHDAARHAADIAEGMMKLGLHKQVVNRVLEPYQWMHTIVSATEWPNFFDLRLSPMAEPNMRQLAQCMKMCIDLSKPVETEYHIPYVTDAERESYAIADLMMISAARCARVSYLTHDGATPDVAKDLILADTLFTSKHASPFEHQAEAMGDDSWSRNFCGWEQHREIADL